MELRTLNQVSRVSIYYTFTSTNISIYNNMLICNIVLLLYIYYSHPTYFQTVTSDLNSTDYFSHFYSFREGFFKESRVVKLREVREAD